MNTPSGGGGTHSRAPLCLFDQRIDALEEGAVLPEIPAPPPTSSVSVSLPWVGTGVYASVCVSL